jgi:hypothetical protein
MGYPTIALSKGLWVSAVRTRAGTKWPRILGSTADWLIEHRMTRGKLDGRAIPEAADSPERAEVMIEGSVFLHQDNDVLDIAEPSLGALSKLMVGGQSLRDSRW